MIFKEIISQLPRRGAWRQRPFQTIQDITIHHSGVTVIQAAATIAAWHVAGKKWPGIGYHYLVYPSGAVFKCNEDTEISYHNGFCNAVSIGICLIGNFEVMEVPEAQWNAALELVNELKRLYPSIKSCTAHREYKGTTLCPGKNFDIQRFRSLVALPAYPKASKVKI